MKIEILDTPQEDCSLLDMAQGEVGISAKGDIFLRVDDGVVNLKTGKFFPLLGNNCTIMARLMNASLTLTEK